MEKTKTVFIIMMILFCASIGMAQTDITSPNDEIKGVPDDRWPAAEDPPKAIDDNVETKYLNFRAAQGEGGLPVGFAVKPVKTATIAGGMTFTSANDAQERDPIHYQLYGSNDSIDGPFTLIAEGDIVDFINGVDRHVKTTTPIRFANETAYDYYQVLFTAVRALSANSMQVAEVEILEMPENGWSPEVSVSGKSLLRLPENTINLTGSVTDSDSSAEDLTILWSKLSGPGTVDFGGTETQTDATATFSADSGVYELIMQVTDEMGNDANDILQVRVWDPATEDAVIGHWALNDGPDSLVALDSTGVNHGILSFYEPGGSDPNWAPGWIPSDEPDNWALDFSQLGFVKVEEDPNIVGDNMDPQYSITVAAWVRALNWEGNHRVLQKGLTDNQYRLLAENGAFVFHLAGVGRVEAPLPAAGLWHHVAGTYDGSIMKLYIDGTVAGSLEATGLIGTTDDALYIGTKSEFVDPTAHPNDYLVGSLDDIWIYNYPLSDAEMLGLVALGENAAPTVTIVQPEDLVMSISDYIDMDATVQDVNGDEVTKKWTLVDGPAAVTFEPGDDVEDVRVVFTDAGTYTLRLTVADAMFGLNDEIFAEVTVTVTNPTCADVIAAGLGLVGDFDDDCDVDLEDLAVIMANWLRCVDPLDPECENPFRQ